MPLGENDKKLVEKASQERRTRMHALLNAQFGGQAQPQAQAQVGPVAPAQPVVPAVPAPVAPVVVVPAAPVLPAQIPSTATPATTRPTTAARPLPKAPATRLPPPLPPRDDLMPATQSDVPPPLPPRDNLPVAVPVVAPVTPPPPPPMPTGGIPARRLPTTIAAPEATETAAPQVTPALQNANRRSLPAPQMNIMDELANNQLFKNRKTF